MDKNFWMKIWTFARLSKRLIKKLLEEKMREVRGVRQKWTNTDRGSRVVSQMLTSAWKKNHSYHICESYSDNLAVCLYIISCLCVMSCHAYVMPVCHIYYVVNPIIGMLLSKLCNRNTHVCTSSIRMTSFFYPSVWFVHKLQCFK